MTYQARPNPSGDTLVASRDQIRTNFELIQTQFEQNHVSIANDGKHKFLQLPDQSSAPTTALNEAGFYAKAVSGVSQLFFRGENNGSEYQLTKGTSGVDPDIATFAVNTGPDQSGWTFLPGGLIMQYGYKILPTTSGTITFPKSFTSAVYSLQITVQRNAPTSAVIQTNPTTTGFSYLIDNSPQRLFYLVIGV